MNVLKLKGKRTHSPQLVFKKKKSEEPASSSLTLSTPSSASSSATLSLFTDCKTPVGIEERNQELKSARERDSESVVRLKSNKSSLLSLWKHYRRENLSLDYTLLYDSRKASALVSRCESEIVYNVGHLARVRMFGKWIDIPRKQVAFGDSGLTYTFSGNTVPAKPWTPLLLEMKDEVSSISGYDFNFVLVNRYQDGNDYMGEHKDDEKDLCADYPIVSLSLGQPRDFVFKHQDCRGKNAKRRIDKLSLVLESGSVLMMNPPTNSFWYHSLPKRPKVLGMRLNFTFRKMVPSMCKPAKEDE